MEGGKKCCSVVHNTLHSDLNIDARRNKWEGDIFHVMGKKQDYILYNEKDLLTLNYEK